MIPNRNRDPRDNIRHVATFMSDLRLINTPERWRKNLKKYFFDEIISKYSSKFPSYRSCDVEAQMVLVNHEPSLPKTADARKKLVRRLRSRESDIIAYLLVDFNKHTMIKKPVYTWDRYGRLIFSVSLHSIFDPPGVSDLLLRVQIDENFNHWRYAGDDQWELLKYEITNREEPPHPKSLCSLM